MAHPDSLHSPGNVAPIRICPPRHLRSAQSELENGTFNLLTALGERLRQRRATQQDGTPSSVDTAAIRSEDMRQKIQPDKPLILPKSARETITCDVGTVWITQGDSSDYVLRAGDSLTLNPKDEVIVSALARPALVRRKDA